MRVVAFDAEGDAGERGIQGCAFYGEGIAEYFTEPSAIRARLIDLYEQGYDFVAHNAEYDIAVIMWQLDIPTAIITYQGRFHHGEWKQTDTSRKATIWDSLSLAGYTSIAGLGDALGIPKYKTPQRLLGKDPDRYDWKCDIHGVWECEPCYAIRDAEICYRYFQAYLQFVNDYGVQPRHTLASTAVALWKEWDKPSVIGIRSRRMAELGRLAYHGGRTEVFIYGNTGTIYAADFDSMYPSVMRDMPMPDPNGLHYIEGGGITKRILQYEGVTEAYVYVPPMHVPPLGVSINGRYQFPIGYVRGAWANCELRAALERGCRIERIYRAVYSERIVNPFITFVDVLHTLKRDYKKSNDARYEVAKRLMNSLYGRMGLSGEQEKKVVRPATKSDTPHSIIGWEMHIGHTGIMLAKVTRMNRLPKDANILWAVNITAYARIKLLSVMEAQGADLVYTDTDSIFSRKPIIGLGEGLGQLTDEGVWDESLFLAPKMYRLMSVKKGERVKAKGIPKDVAKEYIERGEVTFSRPWRIGEAMVTGDAVGSWHEVTKRTMLLPAKRHLLNPDWRAINGYSETQPVSLEPADEETNEPGIVLDFASAYIL